MRRSLRRMLGSSVKKDGQYDEVILQTESCTSLDEDPLPIYTLIAEGNVSRIHNFIMKNPASLTVRDDAGATPLHHASKLGNIELILMFINESAEEGVNTLDSRGNTPLHWAVVKNKIDAVKVLLCRGADPNILNLHRQSPLHAAVQLFHNSIVEVLIQHCKTNINLEGDLGNTAVLLACYKDNDKALRLLLNYGARLCKKNKLGCYPIHMTVFVGSLKCMDIVLKKGAEDGCSIEDHINFTNNEKTSPLHVAVQNGNLEVVKACISYGAKIDLKQADSATALHFAATQGATEIVKFMVSSYKGDKNIVDLPDGNNETPLHKSVLFDHAELAEYLLSMGANIDSVDKESRTPLLLATSCSAWKTVNLFLSKGANVKLTDNYGRNFLHLAVLQPGGLKEINAEFLQKENIKQLVSDEDDDGCTPLHYACKQGVPNSVNNLLGLNVSLYTKSKDERSPLHFAACYGRYNTCQRLLRFMSDARLLNDGDEKGMTPLHLAAQNGHDKIAFLLLKRGTLLLSDYRGWTALHYAAYGGYTRTIKVLLDTSIGLIDKTDKENNTAMHIAGREGHAKAVDLFLDYGAAVLLNANGASFLHEAIRNGKKEVVFASIMSDRWEEVLVKFLHNSNYKCPILEMVYHLPESFKALLDRCTTESPGDRKSPNFYIEYNFKYLQCPQNFRKLHKSERNVHYEPLTTLNAMVQHQRVELLQHPVCKEFLLMKWMAYGFKAHLINLALYSLGLIPLTLLIMNAERPESLNIIQKPDLLHLKGMNELRRECLNRTEKPDPLQLKDTYFIRACMGIVLCMSFLGIIKELVQLCQQKLKYIMDHNNVIDWTIHISSIIFVSSLCQTPVVVSTFQWQFGAVAVFASWVNFLIYLQRFETYGIYIVMFWEILRTLLKIVFLFFFLILAFALSFFIFLYPQRTFSNPFFALMQTFTMMMGDINYQEGILDPLLENQIEYPFFTFFQIIVFTLLIPILLMNLLIGLAVGDIAEVQRNASLKRIAMQVSLHTSLEKKLPYWFLKRVDQVSITVYPNRPRIWGIAFNSDFLKYFISCEDLRAQVPSNDETMELELWKQKNRLKDLTTMMQKQNNLIKLIIQKMEIVSEAEEEDCNSFQNNKSKKQKLDRKDSKWDCVVKAVKSKHS
ncbi:hypothetical protein GDO86_010936 [Hymenochirus boettgeri]|uniref:Ion transport domain-containing protein n=1 Tax=Hymenochirus boettgeri TaxID=247094 RepID=A0A8T2J9S0_9PIPI|nr:hypothetical protein GDO86_010936 [Hymenochirus boettgeri]